MAIALLDAQSSRNYNAYKWEEIGRLTEEVNVMRCNGFHYSYCALLNRRLVLFKNVSQSIIQRVRDLYLHVTCIGALALLAGLVMNV